MTQGPTRREFLGSMAGFALLPLEQDKPELILHNGNIWTVLGLAEFCYQLDFDAGPKWNLRDAESASGVWATLAKDLDEQLRSAIRNEVLLYELRSAVDEDQEFNDA